jgi:hypothetical protein
MTYIIISLVSKIGYFAQCCVINVLHIVINVLHIVIIISIVLAGLILILLHIFPDIVAIINNGRWQLCLGPPTCPYPQLHLYHTMVAFL